MQLNNTLQSGAKLFIQLTGLSADPLETKWVRDEEDLRIALEQVAEEFEYTHRMIGKKIYKNRDMKHFDFVDDVKRAIEETLLRGRTERDRMLMRKRNIDMYHLILEPTIELIGTLSHDEAIKQASSYTKMVYEYVTSLEVNTHYDDALVARTIVKAMVVKREEARKQYIQDQKRARRKKKKDIEELFLEPEPVDED